jgi:hypothetical protein
MQAVQYSEIYFLTYRIYFDVTYYKRQRISVYIITSNFATTASGGLLKSGPCLAKTTFENIFYVVHTVKRRHGLSAPESVSEIRIPVVAKAGQSMASNPQ